MRPKRDGQGCTKMEKEEETLDTFLEKAEVMEFSSKLESRSLGRDTPTIMEASALSYITSLTWQPLCLPHYGLSFVRDQHPLKQSFSCQQRG